MLPGSEKIPSGSIHLTPVLFEKLAGRTDRKAEQFRLTRFAFCAFIHTENTWIKIKDKYSTLKRQRYIIKPEIQKVLIIKSKSPEM